MIASHKPDDTQHEDDVTAYAEQLASALAKKHFPNTPDWKPMTGDLMGLLTQIDNMTAGLSRQENVIEFGDIPGQLDEKTGMKYAYGVLWASWQDKQASHAGIARNVLMIGLTKEERGEGIQWANDVLDRGKFDQVYTTDRIDTGPIQSRLRNLGDRFGKCMDQSLVYDAADVIDRLEESVMLWKAKYRDHVAPEMTLTEEGYHAFYTVLERNGGPGDAEQHCPYTVRTSDEYRQWMIGWGSAEDRWLDEK